MLILAIVVLIIYLCCPIIGKVILLALNTFLPDPIPFVDEIIMWLGLCMNLAKFGVFISDITEKAFSYIKMHKNIFIAIGIIILVLLISCLF